MKYLSIVFLFLIINNSYSQKYSEKLDTVYFYDSQARHDSIDVVCLENQKRKEDSIQKLIAENNIELAWTSSVKGCGYGGNYYSNPNCYLKQYWEGVISMEGQFENGSRVGVWKTYFETGVLHSYTEYSFFEYKWNGKIKQKPRIIGDVILYRKSGKEHKRLHYPKE